MGNVTGELVRAQAAELRGAEIGEQRAQEIAADIEKINGAVREVRELLDFNDEPARFLALLCVPPAAVRRK